MKKVYVATNPINAHLLKGILEGENIEAIVQGEFLWGARGEISITPETSPSVWVVDDADYDHAIELINTFQTGDNDGNLDIIEWKCSKCGEANEGQFSECWQCGTSRPLSGC
jgi:Putative prokaryotic signal transducing protein